MTPTAIAEPVAITGMSLCNALGSSCDEVREALAESETKLGPSSIELPFETQVGAIRVELPALDTELGPWATRVTRIAALLLRNLEDELTRLRQRWRKDRIAVILGTSTAGAETTEAAFRHFLDTDQLPDDYDLWRQHTYGAVLHVVRALTGAQGPGWVASTACTSSAKPLASAQRLINADLVDAAIVGGIDTLCAMTLFGFNSLGALSSKPCRPFAAARDGISIGEGGALLVLERRGRAIAWLDSVGESSDAYHISAPHPRGLGAQLAMRQALARAGCDPSDVDHINAHGTGTRHNDEAEAHAILEVFGDEVPVVSTKGYTGHTLGAAGATEAVLASFALTQGWIPASLGAAPLDEKITIHIATERTTGSFNRVLSNSFAFGGNNVSVLLRSV
ncbi:MAG: beta-ketoacyl-ACP synthase [Myxococcales bacterium]|nr:beta-ketoacyl-ACP synthase [Myxococcales bacterium]